MDRPYSSGKTTASLVALFVLLVVVALIFFRLSGNTPDLQNIVGNTIKKMDLLSEIRVNLLRSRKPRRALSWQIRMKRPRILRSSRARLWRAWSETAANSKRCSTGIILIKR